MRLTFIREQRWPEVLYDEFVRRKAELPGPLDDETAQRIWSEVESWMFRDAVEVTVDAATTTGADLRDLAFDRLATDEERRAYARRPDLVELVGYPSGQNWVTGRTLAEIGALENTVLQLRVPVVRVLDPFVDQQLVPVPDPVAALDRLLTADGLVPDDRPVLWGVLLYTDEDDALATYVRRYFDELDALSGQTFRILVMEDRGTSKELYYYWRNRDNRERSVWKGLGWLRTKPYKRERAYEVADRYGVDADQLPCLMLVGGPESDGRIIFPIREVSPRYLRTLFAELTKVVRTNAQDGQNTWERVSSAHTAILKRLKAVDDSGTVFEFRGYTVFVNRPNEGEPAMGDTFNFHGPTTFVNRPTHVVLRDFQNRYGTPAGLPGPLEDVSRLIELAMNSTTLADDDKELAVTELHHLADQLTGGNHDDGPPRKRLEKVSAILGRAADVAEPSARLLASVFGALG